jgi:hypothetical protein
MERSQNEQLENELKLEYDHKQELDERLQEMTFQMHDMSRSQDTEPKYQCTLF